MGDRSGGANDDDATDALRRHAVESGARDVLERIARGDALPSVLERIIGVIEGVSPGSMGSVLLLDRDGAHVRHGAAPNLPPSFVKAIDGSAIGPDEGSCGAAASRRERVIVGDIETHPNWAKYKQYAVPVGLRACWSTPILSPDGDVLGTLAIYYGEPRLPTEREIEDVNVAVHLAAIAIDRDRAEEALHASERRYRRIFETVSDVIHHIDVTSDGRFRFAAINPAFTFATGLSPEQVVGKYVEDVIPPESIGLVLDRYRTAIAERRTVHWEEISRFPTGTKIGAVSITPDFDAEGQCTHLVGMVRDITADREAQRKIAAQAALLDKARDAIVVLDLDQKVLYWNESAHRIYGYTAEEALGRRFDDMIEVDPRTRTKRVDELFARGESTAELLRRTRQGVERVVESSATLLRDETGAATSILLIETDLTERKSLESQYLRAHRLESLGTLAGGVAHDFNNILTGILGHVGAVLRALPEDHRAKASLEEIEKASWRAADLTRRILTFSRRVDPSRQPTDLHAPIGEAVELLRATIPPPIAIRSALEKAAPQVLADATAIHQVVMNLGTNAAYAIGSRPGNVDISLAAVTVETSRVLTVGTLDPGRYAVITVRDDGGGMDRATIERIFEPFFTTKSVHGTGLGLSVVHGIVSSHGGAIAVESELGKGTEFRIYLRGISEPVASLETKSSDPSVRRGRGERILFVDDEKQIVELAREALPDLGYSIRAFVEPRAALAEFESNVDAFDALLTDSAMHGMTGLSLVRRVRALRPDLPVLVISSHLRAEDEQAIEELDVDEFLAKPVVFDRIAESLRRAIDRRSEQRKRA